MTDETSSLKDDISFLRSLAEAGRDRPIRGGIALILAGTIFGSVAMYEWLALIRIAHLSPAGFPILWIVGLVLFLLAMLWAIPRTGSSLTGSSTRAFSRAWSGVGIGILVVFLANVIALRRTFIPQAATLQMSTYICFYGVAWYISAGLAEKRWFLGVALAAFAFALELALVPFGAYQMLSFAVAIISLALVPGIYLVTRESH